MRVILVAAAGVAVIGVMWFATRDGAASVPAPPPPPPPVQPEATPQTTNPPRDASVGISLTNDQREAIQTGMNVASDALSKDFLGAAVEGANYIGRQVAQTSVGDEVAPYIATGSAALMYALGSAAGIAAVSGPGAFLAITAMLIAVNVTFIVDNIIIAVGIGEWAALAEQIATLRNSGRAREAQELFKRGVTEKRIDRSTRQRLTDHFTVNDANRKWIYPGYPDLPTALSPSELAAHPEQWPDSIVTKGPDGIERTCDPSELMRLAVKDVTDVREWALANGVPGLVVQRTTQQLFFTSVVKTEVVTTTSGPRDVRAFEAYAKARADFLEWCRLVGTCAPWIDSGAVASRYAVPLTPEEAAVDATRAESRAIANAQADAKAAAAQSVVASTEAGRRVQATADANEPVSAADAAEAKRQARAAASAAGKDPEAAARAVDGIVRISRQRAVSDALDLDGDGSVGGSSVSSGAAGRAGPQGAGANVERRQDAARQSAGRRSNDD